jgi:hypothetical protein
VIDAAAIGSLNVTVTEVAVTPVAPSAGDTAVTVGGVVSGWTVVKDRTKLLASGFPAVSFTPAAPAAIVAVYVVAWVSDADGFSVATRVVAL